MSDELVVSEAKPLTAIEVRAQVQLIQQVMEAVMKEGHHYGKVPGCGDKPALLKPGAEKLLITFRLAPDLVVEDLSTEDSIRYRIKCSITKIGSGIFWGAGIGECSSDEEKYKWRKAINDSEYNETAEDRKRLKWRRGWNNGKDYQEKHVRTNPADIANTVLKMAKKRALVDAVLTVTAASDIFEQDLEEMPEELRESLTDGKEKKAPITPPQAKKAEVKSETTASEDLTISAVIEKTATKKGKSGKKEWTLYGILADGIWYNTFSKTLFDVANASVGKKVTITYQVGDKGNNLVAIQKEGCSGSSQTCDLSSYIDGKAFCEDGTTVCMFRGDEEDGTDKDDIHA